MRLGVVVPPLLTGPAGYLAPPLGAARAARAARLAGAESAFVDLALLRALGRLPAGAGLYPAGTRLLEAGGWDVVAFSIQAAGFPPAAALAARLKRARPRLIVVAGGPHALTCAGPMLRLVPHLDYVLRGDAEAVVGPFLEMLRGAIPAREVPGLTFRDGDGRVRHNRLPGRSPVTPLRAEDLGGKRGLDAYRRASGRLVVPVECGRGCSLDCLYCWNCGSPPGQARPPGEVAEEARLLLREARPDSLFLFGLFSGGKSAALRLAGELGRAALPYWHTQCRLEALDAEVLGALARAGCGGVLTLAEAGAAPQARRSGGAPPLEAMRSAWARVRELAEVAQEQGMRLHAYYSFGAAAAAGRPGVTAAMREMLGAALRGRPVPLWLRRGPVGPGELKRARAPSCRERWTAEGPLLDCGRRGRLPDDSAAIRRWPHLCSVYYASPAAVSRVLAADACHWFAAALTRFPLSWACLERLLGCDAPGVLAAWRAWRARQSEPGGQVATGRPGAADQAARDFRRFSRGLEGRAGRARAHRRPSRGDEARWLREVVRYEECMWRADREPPPWSRPGPPGVGSGGLLRVNPTLVLRRLNPGLSLAVRALREGTPLPAWEGGPPAAYAFWSWKGHLKAVRVGADMEGALQGLAKGARRAAQPELVAGAAGIPLSAVKELESHGLLVPGVPPAPAGGRTCR